MSLLDVPLPLKEAQDLHCCRYCGQQVNEIAPDNHLVLDYGNEFAHEKCIKLRFQMINRKLVAAADKVRASEERIQRLKAQRDAIDKEINDARIRQANILLEAAGVATRL